MGLIGTVCLHSDNDIEIVGLRDEDGNFLNSGEATLAMSLFRLPYLTIDACRLDFTGGGVAELAAGDSIEGATSAAWATIASVTLTSGAWGDGDAAGYLTLIGQHGTFESENLNLIDGQANIATISADSTGASSEAAGAKTGILVASHGLFSYENFCYIVGSQNIDGEQDISVFTKDKLTIDDSYVAEKFVGDEMLYPGVPGGKAISFSYVTGSDGNWIATLPSTVKGLVDQQDTVLFITITAGAKKILVQILWQEIFKNETDTEEA